MTKLLLQCDGGSRGNPGPAAYGFVVYDVSSLSSDSKLDAAIVLEKCGKYLGITTNNQAEYQGLLAGLNWIVKYYPNATVEIKMDSLLIVNQLKGLYKVKSPDLFPLYQQARGIINNLSSFQIAHTYREGNSLADSLVNEALDQHATQ